MEPVEYRAVIRFLYLKGRKPKGTFDEMKKIYGEDARHMMLFNTCIISSRVAGQWLK